MAKENLHTARSGKQDEFYTLYENVEKEIESYLMYDSNVFKDKTVLLPCDDPEWSNFTKYFAQNFNKLGLKKLTSTSFAADRKTMQMINQPTLFETESPNFDPDKTNTRGKIFTLYRDNTGDNKIDISDLEWKYLAGDGDFRSKEICALRDDADIVVTNPPFSIFRDFLAWIIEGNKKFLTIGNINALSYKEVFPLIKENKMWLGVTNFNTGMYFRVPENFEYSSTYKFERELNGEKVNRVPGVCWFSNIEHGRRHQSLSLMTMAENLRFSRHKEIKGRDDYEKYDNYDAIEVPFVDAIPSDYKKVMGVPITFLDKYSPDQFEILGMAASSYDPEIMGIPFLGGKDGRPLVNGRNTYARIFIRHRNNL
jgi:hypothetical protein